ncbi:probable rho GDP-dissociation inhibitor [Pollicipes pollicipes]|uniref:probable rho GDP-dissociation inhibitor n=1 Tax=Pollicipes pollicipes TaxID=41117 RepID=UPI001884E5B5|nr:probable rho GDP-dissociation inhibitor [Pollicipes pollicipes]
MMTRQDVGYAPPPEKSLNDLLSLDTEDESLQKYKATLLGQATAGGVVVDESNPSRVIVRRLALVVEGREDVVLDLSGDLEVLKQQTVTIKEGIQYRLRIEFHVQRDIVTGLRYTQKTYRKGIQGQWTPRRGERRRPEPWCNGLRTPTSHVAAEGAYHSAITRPGRRKSAINLRAPYPRRSAHLSRRQTVTIKEGIQYRLRIEFHVQRDIVTGLRYTQKTYRKGIQVDKMNQMLGSYGPRQDVHTHLTPMEDAPSGMLARGTYNVKSVFCDDDKNEYLKWEWSFEIKKEW